MALDFTWQDGERVLFLGDTVIDDPVGYAKIIPTMVTARYPELQITYNTKGVGGNRINDLLERLDRDVFDNDPLPSWIMVSIGSNDVWHGATGTPVGRFRDLYDALLLRLVQTKATICCVTTTVIGEELDNEQNQAVIPYNDAIRTLAFTYKAQMIDVNAVFQDAIRKAQAVNPDFRFTTDGLHLNTYGNYLFSLALLKGLNFSL